MRNVRYLTTITRSSAQKINDKIPRTFSGRRRKVVPDEALLDRVERRRADVAVDDPERAERQQAETVSGRRRRRRRRLAGFGPDGITHGRRTTSPVRPFEKGEAGFPDGPGTYRS
jgi:hypothetical protein